MVQVDVFWSYGLGAGFALAAAHQLRQSAPAPAPEIAAPRPDWDLLGDRYLTATLLYLGALFAPSGAWLLWGFPSWETMHASQGDLPAWLVAAFVATNVTQGVLGFAVTRYLLRTGRSRLAYLQFVAAYFAMFFILVHGWDGTGYQRFFSATPADYEAWRAGATGLEPVREWLTSDVALTLYGMGAVLVPVLLVITARWHAAGVRATGTPTRHPAATFTLLSLASIFGLGLGGAIAASALVHALGWALGAVVFAAVAAAAFVPRRGPAGWITLRMAH
jgi:hypothetical protein